MSCKSGVDDGLLIGTNKTLANEIRKQTDGAATSADL